MKKVLSFLMLVLIISAIFSSCKKDKNEEPQVTGEKWLLEKAVLRAFDSAGGLVDSLTDSSFTANDYLSLQSNGKFEWVTDGQIINGNYKIENSVLFLSNQTGSLQASIVEKSSSKFTFFWDEVDISSRIRYTFYYKL